MRVSKELPNSATLHNLGTNALYLIASLPEEERGKEHVTEKGEVKAPEDMTSLSRTLLEETKKELNARQHIQS